MGSPSDEPNHESNEAPQHEVTFTKGFYIGKHEVTQSQYLAVMGVNPSHFGGDLDLPVEMISQADAIAFANQLTQIVKQTGNLPGGWKYDLPTESEWEYSPCGYNNDSLLG